MNDISIGDMLSREKRSFRPYQSGKVLALQMSKTLSYLLDEGRYNKRVRPNLGKEAVEVEVNLSIRSIGPVDELTQVSYKFVILQNSISFHSDLPLFTLNRVQLLTSLGVNILFVWLGCTFFTLCLLGKISASALRSLFSKVRQDF